MDYAVFFEVLLIEMVTKSVGIQLLYGHNAIAVTIATMSRYVTTGQIIEFSQRRIIFAILASGVQLRK